MCGQDGLQSHPFNETHGIASVACSRFGGARPSLPDDLALRHVGDSAASRMAADSRGATGNAVLAAPALQVAATSGATIRAQPREDLHMATDYDASRKTEDEQKEESLEARRLTSGEQDKTSGKVDEDETELAESYELPGADLSHEILSIEVTPKQADEFTCTACFLVQHESRRSSPGVDLCGDCA